MALRLRGETTSYSFRPKEPEIARLEKSSGITRRLVVPTPSDAIVLQAVVNAISGAVIEEAPTDSAFFAASHRGRVKTMADIDGTFPSDWLGLWKEGQRRIMEFTRTYPVLVVTDVANYFDSVPHGQLRNRLAALGRFDETLVDLLFYALESLTWRPEYLPRSGVGLPQIAFDAPRLLAHLYLYEADRHLDERTDFVRWMDDITFGAQSVTDAKRTLRDLDELLSSLGVRLHAGKTKILTGEEGAAYFRMDENRALTVVDNLLETFPSEARSEARRDYLRAMWRRVYRGGRAGYWSKVVKRSFTLFTKTGDAYLQRWVPEVLAHHPDLRPAAFRYLRTLGYSRRRFKDVVAFVQSDHCLDDASLFGAVQLLCEWALPLQKPSWEEAAALAHGLVAGARGRAVPLCAALWLLAKYGPEGDLGRVVMENERAWRSSEWASRQVAAATVRMSAEDARIVAQTVSSYGLTEGSAVLLHLQQIGDADEFDDQVRDYVQYDNGPARPYPLPKVLTTLVLLRSRLPEDQKAEVAGRVLAVVNDPWYERIIRQETARFS